MDDKAAKMRIDVTENGPYLVSGNVPLVRLEIGVNEQGESLEWRETGRIEGGATYALCRCGKSKNKPFCDGAHFGGFDGAETAGHDSFLEYAESIDGPGVLLRDARRLCAEARFCDRAGGLWNLVEACDDPEVRAIAEEEARNCPSGRYVLCNEETHLDYEPELEASIGVVEDPAMGVSGPLYVRGGIPIFDAEGAPYEVRNRVTLCRCGCSQNKPFCDGTHLTNGFVDEKAHRD